MVDNRPPRTSDLVASARQKKWYLALRAATIWLSIGSIVSILVLQVYLLVQINDIAEESRAAIKASAVCLSIIPREERNEVSIEKCVEKKLKVYHDLRH